MPDQVSVTSSQSWFSRLGESIKSVLAGILFFVLAFPLLTWNEGRAVETARSLDEGAGIVISVPSNSVDAANDGQLVHIAGKTHTDSVLRDDVFGVEVNAIKLIRQVEMYQWVESTSEHTEKKLGGGTETTTTYSYSREWRSRVIDSSQFHQTEGHQNPAAMTYRKHSQRADSVTVGDFTLSESQIAQLENGEALRLSSLPESIVNGQLVDGIAYISANPSTPQVGDMKISFRIVTPGEISIVAQQLGNSFTPYLAKAGGTVFLLEEQLSSAEAMFQSAHSANNTLTWMLRLAGFLLMFFGLRMVFQPIAVFGDVIPLVGNLLGAGLSLFCGLSAACFASVTIAIAWFAYRPLLSIVLLAVAAGAFYLLKRKSVKNAATPEPAG